MLIIFCSRPDDDENNYCIIRSKPEIMSKELKMYVPVTTFKKRITGRLTKPTVTRCTTLIGVHNCSLLRAQLPSNDEILEHMIAQRDRMNAHQDFVSIKMSVTPGLFKNLCLELGRKMGGQYVAPIIDMVVEPGQKPIIQIQGNKIVPVRKFVRTAPVPRMCRAIK
jgi:hypothetical protein